MTTQQQQLLPSADDSATALDGYESDEEDEQESTSGVVVACHRVESQSASAATQINSERPNTAVALPVRRGPTLGFSGSASSAGSVRSSSYSWSARSGSRSQSGRRVVTRNQIMAAAAARRRGERVQALASTSEVQLRRWEVHSLGK